MKIGIVGAAGRMGRMLIQEVLRTEGCTLSGATEWVESPVLGQDVGTLVGNETLGIAVSSDPEMLFKLSDAVIDFSAPAASISHAALAAETRTALVVGTTGLKDEQRRMLSYAASSAPIVHAPNMSIAVNMLFALVERVSAVLDASFDIEILEMHHRHTVDAPSGTALGLGEAAAKGRGVVLNEVACRARDGHTGARPKGEIGFATLRGGDVVGDHTVVFAAEGERLELTHKASSRAIFARGAVRAALWCKGKPPGLYSMRDVLDLD